MIKNQKQAAIVKQKLAELVKAKKEFEANSTDKSNAKYELGVKSFDSLVAELTHDIKEYEQLIEGNFHCFKAKHLSEIPRVLISARLAQKISQRELADAVGVKEQQIQRYEAVDYETASWPRIIEVATALNLNICFEKIIIINTSQYSSTQLGGIDTDQVNYASKKIKEKGLLII